MSKPSNQVLRAYKLIEILAGHEFDPLKTSEVATALGIKPPDATRALQNAEAAGWVERTDDGLWRLKAGGITNIAVSVQSGIRRARARFDDRANHLTRSAY